MGKLHTLRRAIERNPKAWQRYGRALGAQRFRGAWLPLSWGCAYRSFVAHVLSEIRDVGMTDDGPGETAAETTPRLICR